MASLCLHNGTVLTGFAAMEHCAVLVEGGVISDVFSQSASGRTLVNMMKLNLLIGSGGVLSHAPKRAQAMLMMIDAFQPEGITGLAVDSIFMMPHLGVLAEVHPKAATEVFENDCLVPLGTCVAPVGKVKPGQKLMDYELQFSGGQINRGELRQGDLCIFPVNPGQEAMLHCQPVRGLDLGEGAGKSITAAITHGVVGLVLDGRGRPLEKYKDEG